MKKLKGLIEKRNSLINEMEEITKKTQTEKRAFSDEETQLFDELMSQLNSIDETIKKIKSLSAAESADPMAAVEEMSEDDIPKDKEKEVSEKKKEEEMRAFANYIRGIKTERRAEYSVGNNGDIIPDMLSTQIIEKVEELSPIMELSTQFNLGGTLRFPVYDRTEDTGAKFVDDMEELTATGGKFTTKELGNNIIGKLIKISKSLINNTNFDVAGYCINEQSKAIARFMDNALLNGVEGKCEGVFNSTQKVTASVEKMNFDDLISLQMFVPTAYQDKAVWIMHKDTWAEIMKLKDANERYQLNPDPKSPFSWVLLGKPVYISDYAPKKTSGKAFIAYGDMSGLYVKFSNKLEEVIYREKFASQYAIGVSVHSEFDAKIIEEEKIAVLVGAAGA